MTTGPHRTELGEWVHRPLGAFDPDLAPFMNGLRDHEFRLCRCTRCGSWWFPFTVCNKHPEMLGFEDMDWVQGSGRGAIFAKLVIHQVTDPAFAAEVPYVLAIVELDEGPHFPARLIHCDPETIEIGARVEVTFVDSERAGHTLPFFRPEGA